MPVNVLSNCPVFKKKRENYDGSVYSIKTDDHSSANIDSYGSSSHWQDIEVWVGLPIDESMFLTDSMAVFRYIRNTSSRF